MEKVKPLKKMRHWGLMALGCVVGILNPMCAENVEASKGLGGPSHIGTFEGSTTFTTSSSNGINPGLYLEVIDEYGNSTEYTSEEGVITIPNTQEGAYVTQAKLLGKTKYRDQDTGELLDQWEAGRNLTLESVQMPVLTTTGKNLLWDLNPSNPDNNFSSSGNGTTQVLYSEEEQAFYTKQHRMIKLTLKPNTKYTFSATSKNRSEGTSGYVWLLQSPYTLGFGRKTDNWERFSSTFTTNSTGVISLYIYNSVYFKDIQLEESPIVTSYEPHKTNTLSTSDDIELRGVGDVKDELDLMTGELTERLITKTYDGSENWGIAYSNTAEKLIYFQMNDGDFKNSPSTVATNNLVGKCRNPYAEPTYNIMDIIFSNIRIRLDSEINTLELFKDYLSKNNLIITAERSQKSIKTVALNSTYYFQPVLNRSVEVNGTVLPLVYSVTVPTDPLSFVLNPNAEEGQRFVAPTFTITNDTPASIQIELKAFEQTTNTFRDVLPTKYPDWNQLSKDQSKDFALALLPVPSEGWASLKEGPRYVADSSNYDLGEIKAESSVDFTFTASHGRAFVERLNPQYRLSFMFGF